MKVLNIHEQIIQEPYTKVAPLLDTLATKEDHIWPIKKWPRMRFKNGIQIGSHGGHGPIRYSIEKYEPHTYIQFRFSKPKGFHGTHEFKFIKISECETAIQHTITMRTVGTGTLIWLFAIRPLHNALIEDAFDTIENHFSSHKKTTKWSIRVQLLRKLLARKKKS